MKGLTSIAALVAALRTLPSCGGVECGPGTFRDGEDCVGFDPNDKTPPAITVTPPGRRSRDPLPSLAVLSTDEPAVIFFTTDGSDPDETSSSEAAPATIADIADGTPIKYFAIDRAGNRTDIQTATYVSDTKGPAPVTNLVVQLTGTDASISWTNPTDADYKGTLLARVSDVIDSQPEPGHTYAVADNVSASLTTLAVGTNTAFADSGLIPGPTRYVAWAFDDLGNYSLPTVVRTEIPLDSLAAQFTFDTTNNTLTPGNAQTTHFDFTNTTASRTNGVVTLSISAKNLTSQFFQNPKLEVIGVTNGTFSNSQGTADGKPFRRLGNLAFAPGATATADLTFNVTVGQVVTIDLLFATHPSLLASRERQNDTAFVDTSTLTEVAPQFTITAFGSNNRGRVRQGVLVGEHFIDTPTIHGTIERYDLVTGNRVAGVTLNGGGGQATNNVLGLFQNSNFDTIAVVKNGRERSSGLMSVVRLDEGLHELGRLDLDISSDRGQSRPAMSPDGRILAIPAVDQVALVDTITLTQFDADPTTAGMDVLDANIDQQVKGIVFMGTNRLATIARDTGKVSIIDFGAGGTTTTVVTPGVSGRGMGLAVAPDGKLWVGFDNGVRKIDPTTFAVQTTGFNNGGYGMTTINGELYIDISNNRQQLFVVDHTSGAVKRSATMPFSFFGHWLGAATH